jgi:hypothetical protein
MFLPPKYGTLIRYRLEEGIYSEKEDNKEKLNYKKYCENYTINSQMIQIMDKKYKLNFSD